VVDLLVDLELRVGLEVFLHGGLGVIAGRAGARRRGGALARR
jgi:hypothetical protein